MRFERTAIYLLSSAVAALAGVLVLMGAKKSEIGLSIGTSLIAGSLSSVAFVVIRYFDDTDVDKLLRDSGTQFVNTRRSLDAIDQSLSSLRHLVGTADGTARKRVFDRHPKEEVGDEIVSVHGQVDIDVAGLTLRPFCRDWLATIIRRGDVRLRLLVQDPIDSVFARVCHQESRETGTMVKDVLWVTRAVLSLADGGAVDGWNDVVAGAGLKVEIRWFSDYPTITMTRVGDVLYARARFLREGASHTRTFFERYSVDDAAAFDTFRSYFEIAWESAKVPTITDIDRVA
jgi:hypothetical protein